MVGPLHMYCCAINRNAELAQILRHGYRLSRPIGSNEVPATQEYKAEIVEVLGHVGTLIDCRNVNAARPLHPIWLANELATYIRIEHDIPSILYWLPEKDIRRFHALDKHSQYVRPYGYSLRRIGDIVEMLAAEPASKRAVVSFQDYGYTATALETPCALSTQYLIRDGRLWTINTYRSHDFFAGVQTDPYRISLIQQAIARILGVRPGPMVMQEGSLHYYPNRKHTPLESFLTCNGCQQPWNVFSETEPNKVALQLGEFYDAFAAGPSPKEAGRYISNQALRSVYNNAVIRWLEFHEALP